MVTFYLVFEQDSFEQYTPIYSIEMFEFLGLISKINFSITWPQRSFANAFKSNIKANQMCIKFKFREKRETPGIWITVSGGYKFFI